MRNNRHTYPKVPGQRVGHYFYSSGLGCGYASEELNRVRRWYTKRFRQALKADTDKELREAQK
jgi:hypothetical protein